jgi:hypothetical protein
MARAKGDAKIALPGVPESRSIGVLPDTDNPCTTDAADPA